MKKEKLLVSACLLGTPCRYDGKANTLNRISSLEEKFTLIPVCPEILGGLSIPRPPAEIQNGKVITAKGKDMTPAFQKGAILTLELAKKHQVKAILFKAKSPSCGLGLIYDGTFSRKLISGNGITTELLLNSGFQIFTEIDLDKILKEA